jgi:hypothetical protein
MTKQLTLEDGINAVLDYVMDGVREHNELVENCVDYIDSTEIPELGLISTADYDKLYDFPGRKWEKLFKQRFGYTDHQFIDQHQRIIRATFTERERALVNQIEEVCIIELWFPLSSGKVGGTFYYRSPGKLVYFPTAYDGGIQFKDTWLAEMGWQLPEVEEFLLKIGATKGKRPKNPRPTPSLYD